MNRRIFLLTVIALYIVLLLSGIAFSEDVISIFKKSSRLLRPL